MFHGKNQLGVKKVVPATHVMLRVCPNNWMIVVCGRPESIIIIIIIISIITNITNNNITTNATGNNGQLPHTHLLHSCVANFRHTLMFTS